MSRHDGITGDSRHSIRGRPHDNGSCCKEEKKREKFRQHNNSVFGGHENANFLKQVLEWDLLKVQPLRHVSYVVHGGVDSKIPTF